MRLVKVIKLGDQRYVVHQLAFSRRTTGMRVALIDREGQILREGRSTKTLEKWPLPPGAHALLHFYETNSGGWRLDLYFLPEEGDAQLIVLTKYEVDRLGDLIAGAALDAAFRWIS